MPDPFRERAIQAVSACTDDGPVACLERAPDDPGDWCGPCHVVSRVTEALHDTARETARECAALICGGCREGWPLTKTWVPFGTECRVHGEPGVPVGQAREGRDCTALALVDLFGLGAVT